MPRLYTNLGRHGAAESTLRKARLLGVHSLESREVSRLASTYEAWAGLLGALGRDADVEDAYRRSLETRRRFEAEAPGIRAEPEIVAANLSGSAISCWA